MLVDRTSKLLGLLKASKIKLFDTDICREVKFHGVFQGETRELLHFGLEVKPNACNVHLTLHGGACTTLIDCLTTIHTWALDPDQRVAISTELSVSFYSAATTSQYVDIYTDVLSINQTFAKASALLYVNQSPIAKGAHTLFFLNKSVDSLLKTHQQ